MAFSKITDADTNGKGNLGRPDTPGVTTGEMQRILDELPREVIIPKFNALVGSLEDAAAAASLGAAEGETATTVQAALDDRYRKGETYTREETDAAIGEKVAAIGAGDMAMVTYDPEGKRLPYLPAAEGLGRAAYGGSADGVVAAADKLAAPRKIGNAEFDGSADVSLAQMGLPYTYQNVADYTTSGAITKVTTTGVHLFSFGPMKVFSVALSADKQGTVTFDLGFRTEYTLNVPVQIDTDPNCTYATLTIEGKFILNIGAANSYHRCFCAAIAKEESEG